MAAALLTKSPTCLNCIRRTVGGKNGLLPLVQVRGKKRGRPKDLGVVVRLLEDIPTFGRKAAIFRTDRGRMRNFWFPAKKAEYMTATRFADLGVKRDDIGQRDTEFGLELESQEGSLVIEEVPLSLPTITPARASELLMTLVPPVLTFYRKPILNPGPAPEASTVSPLLAESAVVSTVEPKSKEPAVPAPVAIFGSVSIEDVATKLRDLLRHDPEPSLIKVEGRNVRFTSLDRGIDRVKALGQWEVEIVLHGDAGRNDQINEPINRLVEVVAEK